MLVVLPLSLTVAHPGQGSTTSRVVQHLCHHTLDVVVALCRIEDAQLSSTLAVGVVGRENRPTTLTLRPDNTTHLQCSNHTIYSGTELSGHASLVHSTLDC